MKFLNKKEKKVIPNPEPVKNTEPLIVSSGEEEGETTNENPNFQLDKLLQNLFERVAVLEQNMLKYMMVQDSKVEDVKDETDNAKTEE